MRHLGHLSLGAVVVQYSVDNRPHRWQIAKNRMVFPVQNSHKKSKQQNYWRFVKINELSIGNKNF
jgi:hypothetical protein